MTDMAEWHERLRTWMKQTHEDLSSKWWLWPIVLALELIRHHLFATADHWLAARSGHVFEIARSILAASPIVSVVILSLLILTVLAIHAYFDVRKREVPKGSTLAVVRSRIWQSAPGPRIVLGESGFYVDPDRNFDVRSPKHSFVFGVLNAHLKNVSDLTARQLRVKFTCHGEGVSVRWMRARLDNSKQPSQCAPGEEPEFIFDLAPGEEQHINFVIKEPQGDDCYLFNSDSYNYERAQNPAWKIGPGSYTILAELTGLEVVRRYECEFTNKGRGHSLKVNGSSCVPLTD